MMDAIDIFYIALLVFLMFVLCTNSKKLLKCGNSSNESHGEGVSPDRQGNAFNVPDEPSGNRYGDIFFIEPGSVEANRIRDQLEKDEKDLPSYDEVMRMCNLTTPTAAAAGTPQSPLGEVPAPIGIAALPAPPYSETDPQAAAAAGGATVIAMEPVEPSTSRAAQTPPSSGGCGPPAPPPTAV
ncbi:uncharacterized protein LOC128254191 isoform X10 [Drosophila gunungcola]|uniref:uncharacterized protein LOC128254191 isoform X10 n=1 Tax=Drosophila gunungcola TaxID=103775 RepID=UPI0022DFDF60|nr:uncharacterized protein LOC128254191 isoform X10 [Drosophila gunungcola]